MPKSGPWEGLGPPAQDLVQVLRLDLDAPDRAFDPTVLSPAERDRASRFVPPDARRRYVAARSALRSVLGQALGCAPGDVPLENTKTGKPQLADAGNSGIHFNVSHTGPMALIAISSGRRVGVDIERVRPLSDAQALVDRFFATTEREEFRALPAVLRNQAFFVAWTRKEAFVKATGRGIADTLHRFAVTVDPGAAPMLVRVDWAGDEPDAWSLTDLGAPDGYVGALAVEGSGWHLLETGS